MLKKVLCSWARIGFGVWMVMVCFVFFPHQAAAQSPSCAGVAGTVTINFQFVPKSPMLDRHRSVRWLTARAGKGQGYLVAGLTDYAMKAGMSLNIDPVPIGNNYYCLKLKSVTPHIEVTRHLVYIASELVKGGCEYDAVYAHEGHHVAINQHLESDLRQRIDVMVNRMKQDFRSLSAIREDSVSSVVRRLYSQYRSQFRQQVKEADLSRNQDHAAIDTPEQYKKLALSCGPKSAFQTTFQDALR